MATDLPQRPAVLVPGFALISAMIVALQISFIRALSVATYHHFAYLVISIALLGFGASGTLLSLVQGRIKGRFARWSLAALVLFTVTGAWSYRLAATIPLDIQYLLHSPRQVVLLLFYALLLFIPFFAGGLFVGMVLTSFARRVGGLYAANMIASGMGGLVAVALAFAVPAERIPGWLGLISTAAVPLWVAACGAGDSRRTTWWRLAAGTVAIVAALLSVAIPPELRIDRYKAEAHAQRLMEQGDATLVARKDDPRGRLAAYEAPSMHFALFASPLSPLPPPQLQLFTDGSLSGPLFQISSAVQAPVLRSLPQGLAYRMTSEPDVLILGETTGVNVWLALEHGARSVTVVQSNPALVAMIREDLAGRGGAVLSRPEVTVVTTLPRLFLEQTREQFDVIHLAEAEGMPASAGGLASLREDYLLTVEAMQTAFSRLKPSGLLTVTRGLQTPPRDNIRLFALLAAALERGGGDPASRMLQARNYLAATTVASAAPLDPDRIERFLAACGVLSMDADYYPGVTSADLTRRNIVTGGDGGVSYYHQAAMAAVRGRAGAFASDWIYDLSPPTDDTPYFHSFFRLRSLREHIRVYGGHWFARLELGYAVVALTLIIVLVLGLALVVVPVFIMRRRAGAPGVGGTEPGKSGTEVARGTEVRPGITVWTILHFGLIGLGFMFLEMLFIQRLTRFLGDPLFATTAVLTAILTFAGFGSTIQDRLPLRAAHRVAIGASLVVISSLLYGAVAEPLLELLVSRPLAVRFVAAVGTLFPVSFVLGWQFPAGVSLVGDRQTLLPVAWATNGVASVVAAPLAVLLAMSFSLGTVALAAAGCYVVAGVAALAVRARGRDRDCGGPRRVTRGGR